MSESRAHISVRILDKEYQIGCLAEERTELLDSAEILNAKMREVRDMGATIGLDRIAVIAALNLAQDLLHAQERSRTIESDIDRLRLISERVDTALGGARQLDL